LPQENDVTAHARYRAVVRLTGCLDSGQGQRTEVPGNSSFVNRFLTLISQYKDSEIFRRKE